MAFLRIDRRAKLILQRLFAFLLVFGLFGLLLSQVGGVFILLEAFTDPKPFCRI